MIVAGQLSLQPQPVTAAEASRKLVKTTEWLPQGGPTRVEADILVVEGNNTGWKSAEFNLPVYSGNDAAILCGSRGTGLSDTACLFAVRQYSNSGNANTPGAASAPVKLDLAAHDSFSIGIQNVLYHAEKSHPDIIGSRKEGNQGKLQYYKGQDLVFKCFSYQCEFSPSPWKGNLAKALSTGMKNFGVTVIGNELAGPSIACKGSGDAAVCTYRFEDNSFLRLQQALTANSSAPKVVVERFDQAAFNPVSAASNLRTQFAAELPGCKPKESTSVTTIFSEIRTRTGNDAAIAGELKALKPAVTAAMMAQGTQGVPCSEKQLIEIYDRNGYKIRISFEK